MKGGDRDQHSVVDDAGVAGAGSGRVPWRGVAFQSHYDHRQGRSHQAAWVGGLNKDASPIGAMRSGVL